MRLFPSLLILALAAGSQAVTCFNSKGQPWSFNKDLPVEAWQPCNSTASVTSCCSPRDYCMTNGLCMDAVIDNMMSQQGCTSNAWDAKPCRNYCAGGVSDLAGFHFLWRCDGQAHCCGNNRSTTCCNDPGVKTFVVEVGQQLHQAGMIAITESMFAELNAQASSVTKSTASGSATSTPGTSPTSGSATSSSQTGAATSDNTQSKNEMPQTLIVGLAVGISLAVLLIAALVFFGMQFRKRNQTAKTTEMAAGGANSYDSSYPNNALHALSPHHQSLVSQQLYNHPNPQQAQYDINRQYSHHDLNRQYSQHVYNQDIKPNTTGSAAAELGERAVAELDSSRATSVRR
ncbi:hypothetical protein Micbo1qcDRAFT_165789 [Microdochium bolleyi]|uniref:Mid2 domain-containing protein n=1 Tax=Microdochium bolleyi TaxID=196109 RepID=A0A136IW65_9PEZI|nr:hypothetical protein Micbo1qcDRAFT_165789 [Microdochium bolleyi]